MKKMRGELSVRKSDSCIEYLEITNPKPFRPQITVKLNRFFSRFDFGSPTSENAGVGGTCENIVPLRHPIRDGYEGARTNEYRCLCASDVLEFRSIFGA